MKSLNVGRKSLRSRLLWLLTCTGMLMPVTGGVIAPNLGTAASFGLLGGTISNTGTSVVSGNVGATTTITGFPPGTAPCCTVYPFPSDPTVLAAYGDFVNAFNSASTLLATQTLSDLTSSRVFLSDNVYRFANETAGDLVSTSGISLTFDGPNVFIIEVTRDLTIHGDITMNLVNGAVARNIYWVIGRTATFDPTSTPITWAGDVLAGTSFTMSANTGGSGVGWNGERLCIRRNSEHPGGPIGHKRMLSQRRARTRYLGYVRRCLSDRAIRFSPKIHPDSLGSQPASLT